MKVVSQTVERVEKLAVNHLQPNIEVRLIAGKRLPDPHLTGAAPSAARTYYAESHLALSRCITYAKVL